MKYDEYMDKECIALCDELNMLKGITTFESCCGHLKRPYVIYFRVSNWYSLSLLSRAFDWRYGGYPWVIKISSTDTTHKKSGVAVFELQSIKRFKSEKTMAKQVNKAIENIKFWKNEKYKKYLKGELELL